jgi:hypothetical protein
MPTTAPKNVPTVTPGARALPNPPEDTMKHRHHMPHQPSVDVGAEHQAPCTSEEPGAAAATASAMPDLTVKPEPFGRKPTERDLRVAQLAQDRRLTHTEPQLGDYVRYPDKRIFRLGVNYGKYGDSESWQCSTHGGFYLNDDGTTYCTVGSFEPVKIHTRDLIKSDDVKPATFWMFSDGRVEAHNGTYLSIAVRVWDIAQQDKP